MNLVLGKFSDYGKIQRKVFAMEVCIFCLGVKGAPLE